MFASISNLNSWTWQDIAQTADLFESLTSPNIIGLAPRIASLRFWGKVEITNDTRLPDYLWFSPECVPTYLSELRRSEVSSHVQYVHLRRSQTNTSVMCLRISNLAVHGSHSRIVFCLFMNMFDKCVLLLTELDHLWKLERYRKNFHGLHAGRTRTHREV